MKKIHFIKSLTKIVNLNPYIGYGYGRYKLHSKVYYQNEGMRIRKGSYGLKYTLELTLMRMTRHE